MTDDARRGDGMEPVAAQADVVALAIAAFRANCDTADQLPANPLYNSNEAVFGNGGARIIDAMVVDRRTINPAQIISGTTLDIYVRLRFDEPYPAPLVGLTLSNTHGVVVYATHSGWLGVVNRPASVGTVRTYRFRLGLPVSVGSWFVDLAVAQSQTSVSRVRSKALMFNVMPNRMLQGLVDLAAEFEEATICDNPANSEHDHAVESMPAR